MIEDLGKVVQAVIVKDQAQAKIDRWLVEYAEGTSDHKAEGIELAEQAGLNLEKVKARFAEAEELRRAARPDLFISAPPQPPVAPQPKPEVHRRRVVDEDRAKAKVEEPEPEKEQGFAEALDAAIGKAAEPEAAEPKRAKRLKRCPLPPMSQEEQEALFAQVKEGLDEEAAEQAKAEPGEEWSLKQHPQNYRAVLSRKAPLDIARQFTSDNLTFHAKGKQSLPGTYFHQGEWWQWNGAFYEQAPEQRITDILCNFLDRAKAQGDELPFRPTQRDLSGVMTLLRTNIGLDEKATSPRWLDERAGPDAEKVLAFRNCLVDVTTGKTYPHEPWLWLHDGVDFDYDPDARCPRWEGFLDQLFPGDGEAKQMIEEQLGYGMTIDNQFEKAALWIGPARSGRGTLAHIQELLVGLNGHTSLNIHTWHSNENSRMGMIAKRVGIFHDVRLKQGKQYGNVSYDPGGLDPQSQQLLLELISGDLTEIGRKYLAAWKGKPFIKFILISNKVPNFNDEVLTSRFNVVEFTKSFLGIENPALKKTILPGELPGIANRCLGAYRRLCGRGHFVQPKSGLLLLSKVKAATNAWAAFMEIWDRDLGGEGTLVSEFDGIFRRWCLRTETFDLVDTSASNIIQQINRVPGWQWLKSYRPADNGPRRYRVKLKPTAQWWAEGGG